MTHDAAGTWTGRALPESERRYRAFVVTGSEVIFRMSPDWSEMQLLQGNDVIPETTAPDANWIDLYIHPSDQSMVRAGISQAISKKCPFELEHRVIRVDGTLGWTSSRVVPIFDETGEIIEWFGAARDITARKRDEAELTRLAAEADGQRRLYQTILSNTPDLVYAFDLNHRFTYANKALLSMWGVPWEQAVGKNCLELGYPAWHAAMHDREIDQVITTKQSIRGQVPFEGTNGRRIYDYIFAPVFGSDGEVEAIAGTTRDVTEQQMVEEQLRDTAERLRFMAESMPQKIFTTTSDGKLDYTNRQWNEYCGMTVSEMRENGWRDLIHPDDVEENARAWNESLASGNPFQCLQRFRRSDGAFRWHLTRAQAMRSNIGRIIMWIGSNTDIHEQKSNEDELRRANEDLQQFAYSASHDLQEPLRSISIFSQLLGERYSQRLDGDALQFLEYVRSGARRMESLVHDLLAYTQFAFAEHNTATADTNEALKHALILLDPEIIATKGSITAPALPSVAVEKLHLQQLLTNLLSNALEYRHPERAPRIQIAAERQGTCWLFSIKDNGVGIPPEYKDKIFGLFKRLHSADTHSGTGIGLAICRRIVERYGGKIWVESEPGEGSTFRFTLPA